jgi:hypothetical protein
MCIGDGCVGCAVEQTETNVYRSVALERLCSRALRGAESWRCGCWWHLEQTETIVYGSVALERLCSSFELIEVKL